MDENLRALLILNRLPDIKLSQVRSKMREGNLPAEILRDYSEHGFAAAVRDLLEDWSPEEEQDECLRRGIKISALNGEDYPRALREIHDPPLILYMKGELLPEDEHAVAIVGARHPSLYGKEQAKIFSQELAAKGITIVSGLARGIDGVAHEAALRVNGRTIAVLGCGLDVIYPLENRELYETIPARGVLMSEYPLGTQPLSYNFPRRNRLISGLSLGILVVEAHEKSGSLITANLGLEQGKEIFALPGRVDVLTSRGSNRLIKQGAYLAETPEDVFLVLADSISRILKETGNESLPDTVSSVPDASFAAELFQNGGDFTMEEFIAKSGELPAKALQALTRLEIQRKVKKNVKGRYQFSA